MNEQKYKNPKTWSLEVKEVIPCSDTRYPGDMLPAVNTTQSCARVENYCELSFFSCFSMKKNIPPAKTTIGTIMTQWFTPANAGSVTAPMSVDR